LRDYQIESVLWSDGWRGSFGLEPNLQLYVAHAVEIFREVRRVLRPDGTLWLNLGDSYASASAKGNSGNGTSTLTNGGAYQEEAPRPQWAGRPAPGATSWAGRNVQHRHGSRGTRKGAAGKHEYAGLGPMVQPNRMPQAGMKPKDLMGVPWRVAFALQDDGWYLRQDIVWAKPNPMPESVTDRCTKSHEYIFMLTKNAQYYFDQEAILEPLSPNTHLRVSQERLAEQLGSDKVPGKHVPMKAVLRGGKTASRGSGVKNNDDFQDQCSVMPGRRKKWKTPDGWDTSTGNGGHGSFHGDGREAGHTDYHAKKSGNLGRKPRPGAPEDNGSHQKGSVPWEGYERNKRSVWTVTTVPFGGEFCRACQTYFEGESLGELRVEKIKDGEREVRRRWCSCGVHDKWLSHFATFPTTLIDPAIKASCPERGVVLDPFGGAGTTGMAADRLHRDAVLIEVNPEYAEMARQRLQLDAGPMFGDVRLVAAPLPEAAE
jgi:DNA modification methylase